MYCRKDTERLNVAYQLGKKYEEETSYKVMIIISVCCISPRCRLKYYAKAVFAQTEESNSNSVSLYHPRNPTTRTLEL